MGIVEAFTIESTAEEGTRGLHAIRARRRYGHRSRSFIFWYLVIGILVLHETAFARVVRVEIETRELLADGRSFGLPGPYEVLAGKIFFAIDPTAKANQEIRDLDKAPVNDRGEVEFSSDFYLLKPKDISRGNGALLCSILNRGNRQEWLNDFSMKHGYTILWVGWQSDPPLDAPNPRMRIYAPMASDGGKPIQGLVLSSFTVMEQTPDRPLSDAGHIAYEVADADASENRMTVRDAEGNVVTVPRAR